MEKPKSDTSPSTPSLESVSAGLTHEQRLTALAVVTSPLPDQMHANYEIAIRTACEEEVGSEKISHDKNFLGARKLLQSSEALAVLRAIWLESAFVDDETRCACGLPNYQKSVRFNKNSLATLVANSIDGINADQVLALRTRVTRICKAAELFGIISFDTSTGNSKPILATKRLHQLMQTFSLKNAKLIAVISGKPNIEQNPSGNVA